PVRGRALAEAVGEYAEELSTVREPRGHRGEARVIQELRETRRVRERPEEAVLGAGDGEVPVSRLEELDRNDARVCGPFLTLRDEAAAEEPRCRIREQ